MRLYSATDFVDAARGAPYLPKREFIDERVAGKDVLDLGFVGHSLDACHRSPDGWLHNAIRSRARSVLGVDLLEEEVARLQEEGYSALAADALALRLDARFDAVVCADLIEHVTDPAALLDTIAYHLRDDGVGLVTTPNPFAVNRFLNILLDGWTPINTEHVGWFCPQTIFQLVERSGLYIDEFYWLATDFPMRTRRPVLGPLANLAGPWIARKNPLLGNDFGIVLRKRQKGDSSSGKERPFISVVIPTRDRSSFLDGVFRSLLRQDYPADRYELIVVDNGSSDDTPLRLRGLAERASATHRVTIVREERQGLVFARHTGAALAAGDILLFGDDDAEYDEHWVSAVSDTFTSYPEAGAVGTKIAVRWDREPEPWIRRFEPLLGKLDYGDRVVVRRGQYINGGSFAVRKDVLRKVRGFNPGQKGPYIVGDSETGLCRKLYRADILVAWTPAATMWHLQRVDDNGTIADLRRRSRNNGIADAYHATFGSQWGVLRLSRDLLRKMVHLACLGISALAGRDRDRLRHDLPMEWDRFSCYLRYLVRYRWDPELIGEVRRRDWEFTDGYQAPAAEFPVSSTGGIDPTAKDR